MQEDLKLSQEQYANLVKLSGIDLNDELEPSEMLSRAIIAIERKLNHVNYPLSFFTAESINVLIVDDMELSIFQLSAMLKKIGVNVYVARCKEEAIAEIKKKKIDYVVVDLFLPDAQDGFDLISQAMELKGKENKDYKVIVISGTDDPKMVQECYKFGVDEFISKQPQWHDKIMKFISSNSQKGASEEFHKYHINEDICVMSLYKINSDKYVENIVKEVNLNISNDKKHIIFNLEHIKVFSDNYSRLFVEVFKATNAKNGSFSIVKPCDTVKDALSYVFLNNVIKCFDSIEEAIEYVELNEYMK